MTKMRFCLVACARFCYWPLFALTLAILVVAICLGFSRGAHAADAPVAVVVPWGDWSVHVLAWLIPIVVGVALRKLPAAIKAKVEQITGQRVDQLLPNAINYGFNCVEGAIAGQALTLHLGNVVAAHALEYAREHAPALFEKIGASKMLEKIFARLTLDANAAIPPPGQMAVASA